MLVSRRAHRTPNAVKILKYILAIIVIITVVSVFGAFGYLKFGLPPAQFAGQCETLELNESAEDMQFDRERGLLYMSLIDRQTIAKGGYAQGWIGRIDLKSGARTVEPALIDPPDLFRPHGLSLLIDDSGQRTLAVINHPVKRGEEAEHVVLFREEQPGRFRYVRTFTDELITRPNDLTAVGPEQYYIANDSPPNSGETTNLIYVDADRARIVIDDIRSGGGINVSRDGSMLYVAETGGNALRVLGRNMIDGSVRTIAEIDLGTAPDNIDVATDGSLWIGAHSSLFGLVMHFIMGTDAPSQVLRVELDDSSNASIEEIYYNRGDEISAGSVGLTYGNKLLIGSITARRILICEMDGA
jgi:arylesterase/paraoxonase